MDNSSTVDIFINSSSIFQTNLDIPMNIRPLSLNIQKIRMAIIVFGTLINFLVIVVVCNSRQLFYPRHMYWVAISLINQKCIIQAIMEIVAIMGDDKVACQIFVLNAGVNYTIVLVFLALAALDRYLAIARYDWYKKKVTNRGTICLLSIAFAVTYLAATSPFWTGFKNIKNCTINMTHMHVILIHDLILGIICITLHVMIFIRLRAAIRVVTFSSDFNGISIPSKSLKCS
jgi:5-hydroxytryptamine receptor 1